MGGYVASQIVKAMIKKNISVNGAELLMLGITFKENCPDVRNTKIVDVVAALKDYGMNVTIFDPWVDPAEVEREYGLKIHSNLPGQKFDAIVLGVSHNEFLNLNLNLNLNENSVVYDVKGVLKNSDARL